jgi:hypothetical protein
MEHSLDHLLDAQERVCTEVVAALRGARQTSH